MPQFPALILAGLLSSSALVLTAASPAFAGQDGAPPLPANQQPGQQQSGDQQPGAPQWAFEQSDLEPEEGYVFGTLANGMRYILRSNATPEGTALVRMRVGSGSLDETEAERGLSHFLEHMAFNGSNAIPEGEMIKLLEREGLAFGADTNASTGFEAITYMLNLPRNDEDLLGTALMLMRETASELTIAEDAVERERGVILAERRDRRNFRQRAQEDAFAFAAPGARFAERLPIGTLEVLESADAQTLRSLYERTYTPANTVLVIVGDFPIALMEATIKERFADWQAAPGTPPIPVEPETGPIDITRAGETDIYTDPSLDERVSLFRFGPWIDEPDNAANRRENTLRAIGYDIVNRRLLRLSRKADAPFKAANFGSSDYFEDARATSLSISSVDGEWREGMLAAIREVNEALTFGFTKAEISEQIARRRTRLENALEAASTRSNGALMRRALGLVADDVVPTSPASSLAAFKALEPQITPDSVAAALKRDAVALDDPLIRFEGRKAPGGGKRALREAFTAAMALPIAEPRDEGLSDFAYTDFGEPGTIVSDTIDKRLGLRLIRFDNGVALTLKQTDIREDRIAYRIAVDGGELLNTREDPLKTYLVSALAAGGLGKHSRDELSTVLAGRSVGFGMGAGEEAFIQSGGTTPRDLTLQMQLAAAMLTDPGFRPEGIAQFRQNIDNFFQTLRSTPSRAYGSAIGRILSDGDPRFTLQPQEAFEALDYEALRGSVAERFANGAIEIALVGDFDPDEAIEAVAATFGALPPREIAFRERKQARQRNFTETRAVSVIPHEGEDDQAQVRYIWPTTDDSELETTLRLQLLARIMRLELTDVLREKLGQAYSPSASSSLSRTYDDYGTFGLAVSVDAAQVNVVREAVDALVEGLRAEPVSEDLLDRARKPVLEAYDNALKSLGGWMRLASIAQSEPDRLDRWFAVPDVLESITPSDLAQSAQRYLSEGDAVKVLVLPAAAEAPTGEGEEVAEAPS